MWLEVGSGQNRGAAVEIGGEPVTVGSGEGAPEVEPVAGVRRGVRTATALALAALVVAAVAGGLAIAGVFSGGGAGLTAAQVVEHGRPSTVRVEVRGPLGAARGTGWVLD